MVPEGWEIKPLEEIAERSSPIRYGVVQIGEDTKDGVPIVPIKFIGSIRTSKLHRASREIESKYAKSRVRGGDVLISVKGTIGVVGVVPDGFEGNIAREIARIRPSSGYDSTYISLQLQAGNTQREIESLTVGTTRREFSIHALRKFSIKVPPLPEQKKIAKILSTWDEAIATTEQLLTNSEQQKKALMQQLLTGKKRLPGFEGEWIETTLGQLFAERKEPGVKGLSLLSVTSDQGIINRDDVGRKDTSSADKSRYLRVCPGDIAYNTMRMWQGVSALSSLEGIVSPAYTILKPKRSVDSRYAAYLFKLPRMIHRFYRHSQGLVSDTWNLKYKQFAKIKVVVPGAAEQKAIAQVLHKEDENIRCLVAQLELLALEKKALMQQLLTGKRRVKIDEAEQATA